MTGARSAALLLLACLLAGAQAVWDPGDGSSGGATPRPTEPEGPPRFMVVYKQGTSTQAAAAATGSTKRRRNTPTAAGEVPTGTRLLRSLRFDAPPPAPAQPASATALSRSAVPTPGASSSSSSGSDDASSGVDGNAPTDGGAAAGDTGSPGPYSSSTSGAGAAAQQQRPRGWMFIEVFEGPVGATLEEKTAIIAQLSALPGVAYVEEDGLAAPQDVQTQVPSWGLSRLDQRSRSPVDRTFNYPPSAGNGTTVYIIDTGLFLPHPEFEGRAEFGTDITGTGFSDDYGHGTFVAGIVGGKTVGVAKAARLVGVKVFTGDGGGRWSDILAGLNWAMNDCRIRRQGRMCIINMSLGGLFKQSINDAVEAAFNAGLVVVAAAGNDENDACAKSPASAPSALTIGATTASDARGSFSNYGPCVDLYAPGAKVTSSSPPSQCRRPRADGTCYRTLSGTSFAAPHVTGIAALMWAERGANTTAAQIVAGVKAVAVASVVRRAKDTKPLLAYSPPSYVGIPLP